MTIILIGMNDQYAVQVSDRRTSFDHQIRAEEYAKSFSIILPGFKLILGFTGIAHIGNLPTHDFLMTKLCEIGRMEHQPMPLIERLACSLSHRFTTFLDMKWLAPADRRLTITIVGYNYSNDPPSGISAQILNTRSLDGQFRTIFENAGSPVTPPPQGESWAWMGGFGNGSALDHNYLESVRTALRKRAPANAVAGRLEKLIRRMSDDPRSGVSIGKQLDHILIYADPSRPIQENRSSNVVRPEHTMPGTIVIGPGGSVSAIRGLTIESDGPALTIPKVHRNQPCPCGSGKKYRDCHRQP